jgi:hypothetical protein
MKEDDMKILTLERFAYVPYIATFGRLYEKGGAWSWFTLERAWVNNEINISCIPEAAYLCEKIKVGVDVAWRVRNVHNRTNILFHSGNTITDTQGCICLGINLGVVDGLWAVVNSKDAMRSFHNYLKDETEFILDIRQYKISR